jgi:hypothetical protein
VRSFSSLSLLCSSSCLILVPFPPLEADPRRGRRLDLTCRLAGWYHACQLLNGEVDGAKLTDVVEPWFMGGGAGTPGCAEFEAWRVEAEGKGVRFWASVSDLPSTEAPRVALIAGRASDCPSLFEAAICAGVNHIFLEKPGAPSVEALEGMAKQAEAAGVAVSMGYNKNVTKYVVNHRHTRIVRPAGCCCCCPLLYRPS